MSHDKRLKEIVEKLLKGDKRCREKDAKWLTIRVLQIIARLHGRKVYIPYDKQMLDAFPTFESVARCRRDIMYKEGKFNEEFVGEEGMTYTDPIKK